MKSGAKVNRTDVNMDDIVNDLDKNNVLNPKGGIFIKTAHL